MNVMDDTLADESGIPFLSNTDDIPVHSTPIKGTKIPLPSTKDVMKQLLNRPGRYEEYTDAESLQSIRHSDIHLQANGQASAQKGQGQNRALTEDRNFVRKSNDYRNEVRNSVRNTQDLSDIDNLRHKTRNYADIRAIQPEKSRSPTHNKLSASSELGDVFKRLKDVPTRYRYSAEERKRSSPVNNDKTLEQSDIKSSQSRFRSDRSSGDDRNTNAYSSSKNRSKYLSMDAPDSKTDSAESGYRHKKEYTTERKENDKRDNGHTSKQDEMRSEGSDRFVERTDPSSDRKRFTVSSGARQNTNNTTPYSRSLLNSIQNTSLSELENTTLNKQRQEIKLLMGELKDRDRELSDMMTSHQQQLVAWQQDRDRLVMLERKCIQHEEELRLKASQLRNALGNLKVMKTTEGENKRDLDELRSTVGQLSLENTEYKEEISQLKELNETLHENVNDLSSKLGKLETREEELTASLRLKEKDISSATGHMRDLSERLQQLDLKCKECQDRERDALREKHEWKQRYENLKDEFNALAGDMDLRRKEAVRLAEENKSARQQLALVHKEANMMEICKDELIDSMRVKQERTNTQLCNLRELYDRQVREIASLQLQLESSKELLYRQQNSLDDQQLSSSYQGRLSQASEFSIERSSASQQHPSRNKPSPTHSSKYRETDMTGSHQHTQSSGYQSQLYENQTGNHPVPNSSDNNSINLTSSKQSNRQYQGNNSDRNSQTVKSENQYSSRHSESNRLKENEGIIKDNKHAEDSIDPSVDSEIPHHRDPSREVASYNNHNSVSKDSNYNSQVPAHPTPKFASKLPFDSPQRQDGFVVQETTIEIFSKDLEKDFKTPTTCCELSENALEAMRKAEKMLTQHGDTHKEQYFCDNQKEQDTHSSDTHKEQRNNSSVTHQEQVIKPSCDTHKEGENLVRDSHKEQIGYVYEHKEDIKPDSDTHKDQSKNFSGLHKEQGKSFNGKHKDGGRYDSNHGKQIMHFDDTHKERKPLGYAHKDLGKSGNANIQLELNTESDFNNGAKIDFSDKRRDIRVKLDDEFAQADREEVCNKEFEKKYTFENKLCSFLEDLDDIDDSIWDEKPLKSTNVSTTESSPASKLRKLLIESQEMIHSLEKSTDSPRQVLKKDTTEHREKTSKGATGEKVQHQSN